MSENAFERCKKLGGKIKVMVIDPDTGEKRKVCYGVKSKNKKGKIVPWGPVASSEKLTKKKK